MMRKLAQRVAIPGAIAATLLTTTVLGQAEPPTDPAAAAKVGIVNYEQILQQSEDGKRDLARLTQDEQARTQEAQALANELRELQERFTSQQNSLNPESIAEMRNEIGQKEVSLRRFQEDSRSHLEREQRQFFARVGTNLNQIVTEYGAKNGFGLILRRDPERQVYVNQVMDITPDILRIYNERHP